MDGETRVKCQDLTPSFFAFLHEHDYQGYLSMEPHGPKWSRPPLMKKMVLLSKRHIEQFMV